MGLFYFYFLFFALTLPGIIVVVLRVHACASLLATPLGMPLYVFMLFWVRVVKDTLHCYSFGGMRWFLLFTLFLGAFD